MPWHPEFAKDDILEVQEDSKVERPAPTVPDSPLPGDVPLAPEIQPGLLPQDNGPPETPSLPIEFTFSEFRLLLLYLRSHENVVFSRPDYRKIREAARISGPLPSEISAALLKTTPAESPPPTPSPETEARARTEALQNRLDTFSERIRALASSISIPLATFSGLSEGISKGLSANPLVGSLSGIAITATAAISLIKTDIIILPQANLYSLSADLLWVAAQTWVIATGILTVYQSFAQFKLPRLIKLPDGKRDPLP